MQAQTKPIAVVTGAGSGIGASLIRAFLEHGYEVIAVVRGATHEDNPSSEKVFLHMESADLSRPEAVASLALRIAKRDDPIRWLIHCAGHIASDGREDIDRTFAVNTFAPIQLSLALKDNIDGGGGVLFVSSTAGLWGSPTAPLYAASKSALHGFAFSLQKILGAGKRSIVVAPGPTDTPMREAFAGDAAKQQSPEVVAKLILEEVIGVPDDREQQLYVIRNGKMEKVSIESAAS